VPIKYESSHHPVNGIMNFFNLYVTHSFWFMQLMQVFNGGFR